jgi:P27 family predicted phage terminase small subunit
MPAGRPRKPTALKEYEGNPGKRTITKTEPKPIGTPQEPAGMSKAAKAVWQRLVLSMPQGVYTSADETLLQVYCENVAMLRLALNAMAKDGLMSKGSTGQTVLTPWHKVFSDASAKIMSVGARLGLDPAARQSLNTTTDEGSDNEFDIH